MKKFSLPLKTLTALIASLVIALQLQAATVIYTLPAGTAWNSTNLFDNSAQVNSVTINNNIGGTGATNLLYALIDSPVTATGVNPAAPTNGWGPVYFTNAALPLVVQYTTNLVRTVTNFAGLGQTTFPAGSTITNIYVISNVLVTATNTYGPISNVWRRISSGTVGSNSTVTVTGPFTVNYGLGFTNNSTGVPITLTIDYDPSL